VRPYAPCNAPDADHSKSPFSTLESPRRRPCAISFYLVILDFAGFAALLLWGVHMVQTDALRDLKQVKSHLIEGAVYPVLRARGALLPTRLRTAAGRS
jgi:hypothetical protein